MAFITVSREVGSFGTTISRHVAQALDYHYVDKKVLESVLDQYGLVTFHKFYDSTHTFWEYLKDQNQDIIKVFNDTVLEFSKTNRGVFVGRAGFVLLRDYENVLHVFIRSPFEVRVQNIMDAMQITDRSAAAELVTQHDKARETYLKIFYDANPGNVDSFNLVIDTSCIPPSVAEAWIIEAAKLIDDRKIDPDKSTLSIISDPVMKKTVDTALHSV